MKSSLPFVLLCLSCASSAPPPSRSAPNPALAASGATAASRANERGALSRREVDAFVDRGFGQFLARVDVEPSLEAGKFRGFRVISLNDPDFWAGVDLEPGDVVTTVNGANIEGPDQAFQVFAGLKQAQQLRVDLIRDGKARVLNYSILGDPPLAAPAASQPSG